MFGATALLVLFGSMAILSLLDFGNDDDQASDDGDDGGGDLPATTDQLILVADGTEHSGDDGQQAYLIDPQVEGAITANIDAGGGDDIVDLARLNGGVILFGGSVEGGAGNDAISVEGDDVTLSGGDGDDTIIGNLRSSEVNGDGGDDLLRIVTASSDSTMVDGGDGNDTIDGTGSDNISLLGGAGDDLIMTEGSTPTGTGYVIASDGGEGDDTLSHVVDVFPLPIQDPAFAPARLTGGEGADMFDIQLATDNGVYTESDDDPDVFLNDAAVITDFEPGTDSLSFDLSGYLAGYSAMTGEMIEDTDAGTTTITLRLTGGLPDQDIQVAVAATGLTWNDVTFIGAEPGTLIPVAA